jgi:hypothetical protein
MGTKLLVSSWPLPTCLNLTQCREGDSVMADGYCPRGLPCRLESTPCPGLEDEVPLNVGLGGDHFSCPSKKQVTSWSVRRHPLPLLD